eukprot:TRINITY_DN4915_c0_g1_i2.p1 TRINITY_DN4915_c0_g1~~TRINITY_DN4915_c0_g1_i2.p1  ORF type:complete len:279 (+),score=47.94 TRINITY_DN4915_c0_g1_i2:817-1653(+)
MNTEFLSLQQVLSTRATQFHFLPDSVILLGLSYTRSPSLHRIEYDVSLDEFCSTSPTSGRYGDSLLGHPCCPPPKDGAGGSRLLNYLEEYASRLEKNIYTIEKMPPDSRNFGHEQSFMGISLFPNPRISPVCRAVTEGVEVLVSCVLLSQLSTSDCLMFSYSVSMRLLDAPESPSSCQLLIRRWDCSDMDGNVQEVEGPGVIGVFPLLRRGGPAHTYQSMSNQFVEEGDIDCVGGSQKVGGMSGWFLFVPGSIEERAGEPFKVEVPSFDFTYPDYLYT